MKDMERYERMAITKKRRVDNNHRKSAAQSLLGLSEDGNGSTSMSMSDIEVLECGLQKLQDENGKLLRECKSLKQDKQRLVKENSTLKEQCKQLQEECKQLKESEDESESKVARFSLSEESFREHEYGHLTSITLFPQHSYSTKLSGDEPTCVEARSLNKIVVDIWIFYAWPILAIFANKTWFLKVGIFYTTKFVKFLGIVILLHVF